MECSAAAQAGSEGDLSLPGIQNTGVASEFQVEFSPMKGLLVIQGHSRGQMDLFQALFTWCYRLVYWNMN